MTRTNANIYAQIIEAHSRGLSLTLVSPLTLRPSSEGTHTSNKEAAEKGRSARSASVPSRPAITKVAFDRGGRIYHGRVKALADGARAAGLEF